MEARKLSRNCQRHSVRLLRANYLHCHYHYLVNSTKFTSSGDHAGCLSDADDRAYYDRTGRERNAGAVGHGHADPEDIFRQFFGEDFDMASAGAGGVRFHSFGGGMGQGGFVFNVGGMGGPGGAAGAGNGGMAQSFLPWPLGDVLSVVPPQLLIIGLVWLFFWGAAWFMTYFVYFMPGTL